METRANYIAVGIFTLVALATLFAVIFWFGRYGENENLVPVDVRIRGSVSGLGPASLVQFNGIDVGRVTGLSLDSADPRYVIIHTMINQATPVRSDTKATIGIRGLSGGAFIQLEGGSPSAEALLTGVIDPDSVPTIQGDPAALSDLLVRINRIAGRTESVMDTLDEFIGANSPTLTRTIENAEAFSKALSENSDGVAKFMDSAGDVAISLGEMSEKLDGSLQRAEAILNAIDPQSVRNTVENVELFSETVAKQREDINRTLDAVEATAQQLQSFSEDLNSTLARVDGVVAAVDPQLVSNTVASINKTAEQAEKLLSTIDGERLNATIAEAQAATSQARRILEVVDADQVRTMVNDLGDASSEVSSLVRSIDADKINTTVDNLSTAARGTQTIVADISKVTAPLAKRALEIDQIVVDTSAAANQARQILEGVDEAQIRNLMTNLSEASDNVSRLVQAVDAAKINAAVDNISNAAEGAQTIVADISKITAPLGNRAGDIDQIVTDASQLASRLNDASVRVDAILDNVNSMVGTGATDGLMSEVRQTLAQFRTTARNFETQFAWIANNVDTLAKRGLGDTPGLIRDARQSLKRFDRVMRNLESNPSSLITGSGGSRIRESSGSRVRR